MLKELWKIEPLVSAGGPLCVFGIFIVMLLYKETCRYVYRPIYSSSDAEIGAELELLELKMPVHIFGKLWICKREMEGSTGKKASSELNHVCLTGDLESELCLNWHWVQVHTHVGLLNSFMSVPYLDFELCKLRGLLLSSQKSNFIETATFTVTVKVNERIVLIL